MVLRAESKGGKMKKYKLINWLCFSGVIAAVFYLLHDIIGAANYPGYDWASQAVSDLTATDAPSFAVASGLTTVYGILSCLCCALLCILVQKSKKKIPPSRHISFCGYEFCFRHWLCALSIVECGLWWFSTIIYSCLYTNRSGSIALDCLTYTYFCRRIQKQKEAAWCTRNCGTCPNVCWCCRQRKCTERNLRRLRALQHL